MALLSNSKLWAKWLLPTSRRSELGIAKIATMPEWAPVGLMIFWRVRYACCRHACE